MELIPLEIMQSSCDAIRKACEAYLIDRADPILTVLKKMRGNVSFVYIYCVSVYLPRNPRLVILVVFQLFSCNGSTCNIIFFCFLVFSNCNVFPVASTLKKSGRA